MTDHHSSRLRVLHADQPLEAERTHALLEEEMMEKLNGAEEDDEDDVSYVLSRRTSSTNSLSPGLGNRVCPSVTPDKLKKLSK